MAKQKFADVPADVMEAYTKMVAAVDGVELKGAFAPYTSVNGNMYSAVSKGFRIGLRLPKDELEAFLEKYDAELFEPFPGFRQKTYVEVPLSMHSNTRALRKYFKMAHEHASSLKPQSRKK